MRPKARHTGVVPVQYWQPEAYGADKTDPSKLCGHNYLPKMPSWWCNKPVSLQLTNKTNALQENAPSSPQQVLLYANKMGRAMPSRGLSTKTPSNLRCCRCRKEISTAVSSSQLLRVCATGGHSQGAKLVERTRPHSHAV